MSALRSPLPERTRSYRVSLTPLADAMFQLLIFFMLTTNLTPYSLITLRSPEEIAQDEVAEAEDTETAGAGDDTPPPDGTVDLTPKMTIWALEEGQVKVGGQTFKNSQLPELAQAIGDLNNPGNLVVLVTDSARIQDIAATMEALKAAEVSSVRIVTEEGL